MVEQTQENIVQAAQPAPIIRDTEPDMSKTTITVLVLLTLMISIIGTWTVLNEISSVQSTQHQTASSVGRVSFTIRNPNQQAQSAPTSVPATGKVVLSITQ